MTDATRESLAAAIGSVHWPGEHNIISFGGMTINAAASAIFAELEKALPSPAPEPPPEGVLDDLNGLRDVIHGEERRLWRISDEYGYKGDGSIGALVDMTNVTGSLRLIEERAAQPAQDLDAIRVHAENIKRWVLTTNWATTDIVTEADEILSLLQARESGGEP